MYLLIYQTQTMMKNTFITTNTTPRGGRHYNSNANKHYNSILLFLINPTIYQMYTHMQVYTHSLYAFQFKQIYERQMLFPDRMIVIY